MEIRAFQGWRYKTTDGNISPFIAPPYDVLTAADKQRLLERSPDNIVAADLPQVPPSQAGPPEVYRRSAQTLATWKSMGVLHQDTAPAVYVLDQTFSRAGKTYCRRTLLAGVRIGELGKDIIPHEHTFAGPKADRLELNRHTRMQLSPIMGFYSDPSRTAMELTPKGTPPDAHGMLDGVDHRLWVVRDARMIERLRSTLAEVPVFIADGHHRYSTAVTYRDELVKTQGIDGRHEANYVLFALIERDDPGLLILPTHRILRGLAGGFTLDALSRAATQFQWHAAQPSPGDLDDTDTWLKPFGRGAMAFIADGGKDIRVAVPRKAPGHNVADLDVSILHEQVIAAAMAPWKTGELNVQYTPNGQAVMDACRSGAPLGVCLQGTPLEAVETTALAGQAMPHKSTYFFPKIATGLVLKPLE